MYMRERARKHQTSSSSHSESLAPLAVHTLSVICPHNCTTSESVQITNYLEEQRIHSDGTVEWGSSSRPVHPFREWADSNQAAAETPVMGAAPGSGLGQLINARSPGHYQKLNVWQPLLEVVAWHSRRRRQAVWWPGSQLAVWQSN